MGVRMTAEWLSGRLVASVQRPLKTGRRFSLKARTPSW